MEITVLKSKIKKAIITHAEMEYEGSLTLDENYMDKACLFRYEQVHVNNRTNGKRFLTYILPGRRGSGIVALNGAASLMGSVGDEVHILSYTSFNVSYEMMGVSQSSRHLLDHPIIVDIL